MRWLALGLGVWLVADLASAADWSHWRGPNGDGAATSSPPLLETLPSDGIEPIWQSGPILSGREGGWSSPVVADGKMFLFAHTRVQQPDTELPPKKYPWLAPENRVGMTDEEYAAYEVKRRDEDEQRSKVYKFEEIVYCLDAQTGEPVWTNREPSAYARDLQSSSPTVADGKVYFQGSARRARCVDAATGKNIWTTRIPGEFRDESMMSSFVVADGVAVVAVGHLVGLDAQSGELLWGAGEQKIPGNHSSPVVWKTDGRELIIANAAGGRTICLEPKTGKEVWRISSQAGVSTPIVTGNRLITYSRDRSNGLRCFELSPTGAELAWSYRRLADKGSTPVVVDGYVYAQGEKRLACVKLETGEEAWSAMLDLAMPQYTSLVAADGKVIYAYDGVLWFAADPAEYRLLAAAKINRSGLLATEETFRRLLNLAEVEKEADGLEKSLRLFKREVTDHGPLPCSSPAIADGKLFLRMTDRGICYDLSQTTRFSQTTGRGRN